MKNNNATGILIEHGRLASLRELHNHNRSNYTFSNFADLKAGKFFQSFHVPKGKEKISCNQKVTSKYLDMKKHFVAYYQLVQNFSLKQKQLGISRYRELSSHSRERILFFLSTIVGTALFFILFECLYAVIAYNLELASRNETAFVLSYTGAYVVSIVWQHALNRYLVFPAGSYCVSLVHTYLIYSFSYAVVASLGTLILKNSTIHPRSVTFITLPFSGVINYYFLAHCLDGKGQAIPTKANLTPSLSQPAAATSSNLPLLASPPNSVALAAPSPDFTAIRSTVLSSFASTSYVSINIKSLLPPAAFPQEVLASPSLIRDTSPAILQGLQRQLTPPQNSIIPHTGLGAEV